MTVKAKEKTEEFNPRVQVRIQYLHDLKSLVESQKIRTAESLKKIE
jgi:hypothetical protein